MPAARKPRMLPNTPDEVEHAFYEALQHGDLERVMACWADEDDVVCVHPGGARLIGHAAVRAVYGQLLADGPLRVHAERVRRLDAGSCSVHSVAERVDLPGNDGGQQAWVVATNVYAKTVQGWRLVAHHASPGRGEEPQEAAEGQAALLH